MSVGHTVGTEHLTNFLCTHPSIAVHSYIQIALSRIFTNQSIHTHRHKHARMMRETLSVGTISSARAVRGYKRMYSGTMDYGRGLNFQHTPEHSKRIHVNSCESIYIHANQCKLMKTDNQCKFIQIHTNPCKFKQLQPDP